MRRRLRWLAWGMLLWHAAAAPADARAEPASAGPRVSEAARRQGRIVIDGRLDDEAWRLAAVQGGFWQRDPYQGRPPRFATEFRVLYDDQAIYVAVRAFDPEPSRISRRLTRRDVDSPSDWIWVSLDSYRDRRTAFAFGVNPAGVQRDKLVFDDVAEDPGWDAVWESGVAIDPDGWTAELRIPYSQLRFSSAAEQTWGLQVLRSVHRTREVSVWSPWPKEASQQVSLFGTVDGIRGISPGLRLELLPYALAGGRLERAGAGDPARDGREWLAGGGVDLRVGLTPSVTISATLNPDFGQVEADPSQVNLSDKEVFFAEKRPFFLEGADLIRFSLGPGDGEQALDTLFYTRRIGAPPRRAPAGDPRRGPDTTTIYGAGKLTGKTAGWSFGLLTATTAQERAAAEAGDPVVVEPLASYSVGRVQKDLRGGRTTLGATATSVLRALDGTGLEDALHGQAFAGGLELTHRFWDEAWSAGLRLAGSQVRGAPEAIARTQQAPQRYYQRPDADHLQLDPDRTSLEGLALLWSAGKTAGSGWRLGLAGDARTPGFEANDLGFHRDADYYAQWLTGQYRDHVPGSLVRDWGIDLTSWAAWDGGGSHLNAGASVAGWASLRSHWSGRVQLGWSRNRLDPTYLRGGPALRRDTGVDASIQLATDSNRVVYGTVSGWAAWVPASASSVVNLSPAVTLQPRSNLDLSLGPAFTVFHDDNQYVQEAIDDGGRPRYVVARMRQATAALTLRASYTYSPRLSAQLYAQPFVSAGRFAAYKEVVAPRAGRYPDRYHVFADDEILDDTDGILTVDRDRDGLGDFRFARADFSVRELRSNLVVRWEYRPGSTLFFIWSHGRTSVAPDGRFLLADDLGQLAREPGEHVLLAKLTYWFGL
jgi:hypothetical protein